MRILILYSTKEGHTGKIANALCRTIENLGNEVIVTAVSDTGYCDPGNFDAAILCAPIHMDRYPTDFIEFIKDWKSVLEAIPNALLTSSLLIACGDGGEKEKALGYPEQLMEETGWKPDQLLNMAGSLNYPRYDFFTKWVMTRAAASEGMPVDTDREHDFTDWEALKIFAEEFTNGLKEQAA